MKHTAIIRLRHKSLKLSGRWCLLLASFVLLSAAAVIPVLGWCALVGLVPYFIFLRIRPNAIILGSWLLGFMYLSVIFSWFLETRPTNWTTLQNGVARPTQFILWLLVALALSLAFLALGWLLQRIKKQSVDTMIISLVVLWPIMELVRGAIFSVLSYGPGGSIGALWNFGNLALSVMGTPLAFASRLVGFFGLSAVVVAVNVAIYWLLSRRHRLLASGLLGTVVCVSLVGYRWPQRRLPVTATLVHAAPNTTAVDVNHLYFGHPADLMILPEDSQFNPSQGAAAVDAALKPAGTLVTSTTGEDHPAFNQSILYSPRRGIYSQQAKTFLIPTGEYIPYIISGYFTWLRQTSWITQFNETRQIRRGPVAERAFRTTAGYKIGALSCSGILVPPFYQRLSHQGAVILINTASLRFLSGAGLFRSQAQAMAKFDAIANAKYFVQASRGDESFVLDANGHKILSVSGNTRAVASQLSLQSTPTFYSRFGELFLIVLTISAVGYLAAKRLAVIDKAK